MKNMSLPYALGGFGCSLSLRWSDMGGSVRLVTM